MNEDDFLRCLKKIEQSQDVDFTIQATSELAARLGYSHLLTRIDYVALPSVRPKIVVDTVSPTWTYQYWFSESPENTATFRYFIEKCREMSALLGDRVDKFSIIPSSAKNESPLPQSVSSLNIWVEIQGALSAFLHLYLEESGAGADATSTRRLFSLAGVLDERIRTHYFKHQADNIGLTPREIECLEWVSLGKSDWEIGRILNLSRQSVNLHVEKSKKKFDVSTRMQAVVLAMRIGLITGVVDRSCR